MLLLAAIRIPCLKTLISQYYNNLDRALQFGKSSTETAIHNHFWILLNEYATV
ncbi:hypothetical protein [Mucilaginibacter sp.]|uniref:hypothetical protein n=1 Tax=Mucilaginibacter sp. TaxID=1882438 RepID=UPI003B007F90